MQLKKFILKYFQGGIIVCLLPSMKRFSEAVDGLSLDTVHV